MKKRVSTLLMLILTSPLLANPDPGVTLQSTALGYPYTQPFKVDVQFSESVTGFNRNVVNIVNGFITDVKGSKANYVLEITPILPGALPIFIPANVVRSLTTGAPNTASKKLNIMALNPILNPSSNFDLALWTLILPLPLGDIGNSITIGNDTLVGVPYLNTGYINPPYFYTDEVAGSMNFFAPLNGGTTPGSVYARSELTEQLQKSPHTWTLNTYVTNTLTASLLVTQVPPSKKIVIGKIQDEGNPDELGQITASKPLVKIIYDLNILDPNGEPCRGCVYARIRPVPAQDIYLKTVTLIKNTPLNKLFIYRITLLRNGTLTVKVNNKSTTFNLNTATDNTVGWGTQKLFFKAGVYLQENGSSNFFGGSASFYSLQIKHDPVHGIMRNTKEGALQKQTRGRIYQ